jgi:hypothetical protein
MKQQRSLLYESLNIILILIQYTIPDRFSVVEINVLKELNLEISLEHLR